METTITPKPTSKAAGGPSVNYTVPLIILTSLFFLWGFLTVLNDILIPHFKSMFLLSNWQIATVQTAFFGAYFFVSLPAGFVVNKIGYKNGVVVGLLIAGAGCGTFFPAAAAQSFSLFLLALFVMASGITILQVSANPYVTLLGPEETAPRRLTMTQAFNSLGTFIGPVIGGHFILSAVNHAEVEAMSPEQFAIHKDMAAAAVEGPYVFMGICLVGLAIVFALLRNLPAITDTSEERSAQDKPAWQHRHLILGMIGIFAYVGAEVSIGSWAIDFITTQGVTTLTHKEASFWLTMYWGGAMVGRFLGVAIMSVIRPATLLAINALIIIGLLLVGSLTGGKVAMFAILLIGLFNSIMFPTIFSLSINKLGTATSQGSGFLCMAIVGGAVITPLQGFLADNYGFQLSYLLPIVCYAYIVFFALKGHKPREA